ncbi:MAG: hypothetical protein ACI81P_001295 [Neolewinella sp.]|jgi:hypothetical protein
MTFPAEAGGTPLLLPKNFPCTRVPAQNQLSKTITMYLLLPNRSFLLAIMALFLLSGTVSADTFYVSTSSGDDDNDGLTSTSAWQTIGKVNNRFVEPGDSILFRAGETFFGRLRFVNESGDPGLPVVVSRYGAGERPVIDGDGHLATIHLENSGHIHLSELEIKNDGGPAKPGTSLKLRYGLYLVNTFTDGTTFDHFHFTNLTFRNIYSTQQINDNDQTGVNAHAIKTSGAGWNPEHPIRFRDMLVEDCFFTRTGRHAVVIGSTDQLTLRNNLFQHVGGAGMVMAAHSRNILVEDNITDHTGSNLDPRMAARGSGLWAYRTTNLTVQNNRFMHARGIKDSFGMHIDIGNRNVVYQYNYSEDNEGGFVEILGGNKNVGYRYNISVGDGWRIRGPQLGRIFWVGGWSGTVNQPAASDSVFIYNNSVYVRDSIAPRIWIEAITKNTRIYNNIVYVANEFSDVFIKNDPSLNDFSHNIWFGNIANRDTDGDAYQGANDFHAHPGYENTPPNDWEDVRLLAGSPAIGAGKLIYDPTVSQPFDGYSNNGGQDFFGRWVSTTESSNIGAYNGFPVSTTSPEALPLRIYPSPVQRSQVLTIEVPHEMQQAQLQLQLVDTTGREVLKFAVQAREEISCKTSMLPAGSYLMRLSGGAFRVTRWVLVVE